MITRGFRFASLWEAPSGDKKTERKLTYYTDDWTNGMGNMMVRIQYNGNVFISLSNAMDIPERDRYFMIFSSNITRVNDTNYICSNITDRGNKFTANLIFSTDTNGLFATEYYYTNKDGLASYSKKRMKNFIEARVSND